MGKIITFIIAILAIAACSSAGDNPFETGGGKFKLIPCKTCNSVPFYIEFRDGKYSILNGPSGYYTLEGNVLKIVRNDSKGKKVVFHGRITTKNADFVRAIDGRKRFDFHRCGEEVFNNVKNLLLASSEVR